jgi:flagellar L-ring protein precursor FlgH
MKNMMQIFSRFLMILGLITLTACTKTMERLENIGDPPPLTKVENPTAKPDYQPISWPLPEQKAPGKQYAGSLWQPGSRHFFRDQRAARAGDIIRVQISLFERAELQSETRRERDTTEAIQAPEILGLQNGIYGLIPGAQKPNLLEIEGETENRGLGFQRRIERLETEVAALVTQVLPNGNMVIEGTQEILMGSEIRNVSVAGVIRPQDIRSDNTIDHSQIAQARITYAGRGAITNIQRPRWGAEVLDVISPF